jgi:hypothetical protein
MYTSIPTFINRISYKEVTGREIVGEIDQEGKVRSMHTWGDIPIGGAIIFPMMSKAWKEKYKIDA